MFKDGDKVVVGNGKAVYTIIEARDGVCMIRSATREMYRSNYKLKLA